MEEDNATTSSSLSKVASNQSGFKCTDCSAVFKSYVGLRTHAGAVHKKKCCCDLCQEVFTNRTALLRHKKKLHKEECVSLKHNRNSIKCGKCKVCFASMIELCSHLTTAHEIPASVEKFTFNSREEFETWRKEKETEGCFLFVSQGTTSSVELKTEYFHCHRSGFFESESKGLRAPKATKTNRVNFHCSAFAAVKTKADKIKVSACLTHYGHDNPLIRLPIPLDVRQKIAQYIRDERSASWILTKLREDLEVTDEGAVSLQRKNLVRRQDIFNIETQMGLKVAQKSSNDVESIEIWVRSDEGKSLFCYNPQDAKGNFSLGNRFFGVVKSKKK